MSQKKTRPCVVINVHPKLELVTVFLITDAGNKKGQVFISIKDLKTAGLNKPSVIDSFQIRTLSINRILARIGAVSEIEVFECRKNIALIFEIDEEYVLGQGKVFMYLVDKFTAGSRFVLIVFQ